MTNYLGPLDVRCETCDASPGQRCVWRTSTGKVRFRRPHAARVTEARDASSRRERRQPSDSS